MKVFAFRHEDQNSALFDPWSVIHLSAGLFAGLVGIGPIVSMTAAVGYEIFEQVAENQPWGQKIFRTSGSENGPNMITDVLVFAVGWWLGTAYHRPRQPALNPPRTALRLPPPRRKAV